MKLWFKNLHSTLFEKKNVYFVLYAFDVIPVNLLIFIKKINQFFWLNIFKWNPFEYRFS